MTDHDRTDLVSGFLDNRLSQEETQDLQYHLKEDPEFAEAFVASCIDEAKISDWATGENYRNTTELVPSPADELAYSPPKSKRTFRIEIPVFSISLVIVVAAVAGLWWVNLPVKLGQITSNTEASTLRQGFFWRTIREGRRLRLDQGVVEIETHQKVRLVLEAPFECQFESLGQLRLVRGRVYAEVPESGHGFTIATPNGRVIDLGTAFGVEVNDDKTTELHVFQGTVSAIAEFNEATVTQEVTSGRAVVFNRETHEIDGIALSRKFVRQAAPLLDSFPLGPRSRNKSDWFNRDLSSRKPRVKPDSIQYPGLARSEDGKLEMFSNGKHPPETIGRRWHHRYCSFLIYPDDDFPKRLDGETATLVSFGPIEGPYEAIARLVVARQSRQPRQSVDFGLSVDGVTQYDQSRLFQGFQPCLIVLHLGDDQIELWLNPPANRLGSSNPPPPDLVIKRPSGTRIEALWINDPANPPGITWYFLDELRGGDTWVEVTPRSN